MLLTLSAGCVSDAGSVFRGGPHQTTQVQVTEGQRFSLEVYDNPSIGYNWRLEARPDAEVASFVREEVERKGEGHGAGGVTRYLFDAHSRGSTTVKLFNCWRCNRTPTTNESKANSGEAVFRITVR